MKRRATEHLFRGRAFDVRATWRSGRLLPAIAAAVALCLPACRDTTPRACIPGETRLCEGMLGCVGAQACASDGSGFGECACAGPPDAGADAGNVCSCTDGVRNGSESDVDCGGRGCAPCALGQSCLVAGDCASGGCDAVSGLCVAPCVDHAQDGTETAVDCGGDLCVGCEIGERCQLDRDCGSGACSSVTHRCVADACTDHHRNGSETDLDCGGGYCATCDLGLGCLVDTDCISGACDGISLTCVSNACADHRKDGTESDVDCGGFVCPSCGTGQHCTSNLDCAPGHVCYSSSRTCS